MSLYFLYIKNGKGCPIKSLYLYICILYYYEICIKALRKDKALSKHPIQEVHWHNKKVTDVSRYTTLLKYERILILKNEFSYALHKVSCKEVTVVENN